MKKFYTLLLSLLVVATAFAGNRLQAIKDMPLITDDALAKSIIGKKINPELVKQATTRTAMRKAPAKVAAMNNALGEFDCTYEGMLTSNTGTHTGTAVLVWSDDYEDIEITIPECTFADFGADWDDEAGAIVINQVNFGKSGNYYIFQSPLNGSNVTSTMSVPYNESTKSYEFQPTDGLAFIAVTSTGTIAGYYWAGNNFEIGNAEFDYSLNIETSDECSPTNEFIFAITAGADVDNVKIITIEGDYEAASVKQYFATLGKDVKTDVEYIITPENDMEETGSYSVLVAAYNADGDIVKTTQASFIVVIEDNDNWQTIATVPYNNDFVSHYYTFSFSNETCELQENTSTPGLYRLANPHADHTYLHAEDCPHFIYLDATDAEFVNIPFSPTGLDFGDGHLVIGTFGGALGYSKEQAADKGFPVGTIEDRTITFPKGSVLAHESKYNKPGSWSYLNNNSDLEDDENAIIYTLPDLTLSVTVLGKDEDPVEGATVAVGATSAVTDADGVATLTLPADIDYLAEIELNSNLDNEYYTEKLDDTKKVKLQGAVNNYVLNTELAKVVTGIEDITINDENRAEYYNLQGVQVANPTNGIFVRVAGGKATKVVK